MDITPAIPKTKQLITGYGAGGFSVNGERVEGPVLVLPDAAVAWHAVDQVTLASLADITARDDVEILLIGTGRQMLPIAADIRAALKEKRIAVEAMDTGAACRTYNVLLAEGRRVAAALIAV